MRAIAQPPKAASGGVMPCRGGTDVKRRADRIAYLLTLK
jgi:cytochrome c2